VKLERKTIRGVESNGMLCSAKELGLGQDHAGILELDTAAAPGTRFADAVPVADHQIVIDVPASRPDLLCHKGVARELAAVLGGVVKLPEIPIGPSDRRTVGPTHRPTVRQPDRSESDRRTDSPSDRATARPQCGGRRGSSPRGSRGVPPLYGGGDPRGPGGGEPPLARWPAERGRPAADQ